MDLIENVCAAATASRLDDTPPLPDALACEAAAMDIEGALRRLGWLPEACTQGAVRALTLEPAIAEIREAYPDVNPYRVYRARALLGKGLMSEHGEVEEEMHLASKEWAAVIGLKDQSIRNMRVEGTGPPFVRIGGPNGRIVYLLSACVANMRDHIHTSLKEERRSYRCAQDASDPD